MSAFHHLNPNNKILLRAKYHLYSKSKFYGNPNVCRYEMYDGIGELLQEILMQTRS